MVRPAVQVHLADWTLATNPPPSIGGPVLAAMLTLLARTGYRPGRPADVSRLVAIQRAVLDHRLDVLDLAEDAEVRRHLANVSQIDLPKGMTSGLVEAERILRRVRGIAITRFTSADVVRHPLVARIVEAYEASRPELGEASDIDLAAGRAPGVPRSRPASPRGTRPMYPSGQGSS